jgi:GWxTD domain-containing protein
MLSRVAWSGIVAGAVLACAGGAGRGGGPRQPAPADAAQQQGGGPVLFRQVGRMAAGDPLPFVGNMAFAAGSADTALAILGLSLENRALSFQREPNGFTARYRVDITIRPERGAPLAVAREEVVRVATQQETSRADESVLFQQHFKLLPGRQHVIVSVRDVTSGAEAKAEGDYDVPAFAAGTTTAPILAYQAKGRGQRGDPLQLVLNPRGTAGFGGDTLLAYVEGYGFAGPHTVPFEVRGDRDSVVYRDSLRFRGGRAVESQVIRLAPDSLTLGEMRLLVGSGEAARGVTALVSFSPAWLATNYEQMLDYLRYFGRNAYLDSLRRAPPGDRPRLWRAFWKSTDPNPRTPQNEQLDEYFARLATANAQIKDEGIPGWRTDRGEVFITLGEPDEISEPSSNPQGRLIRWVYERYRLTLFFADESGFNRYRLLAGSRGDYERVLARLRGQRK